jgi:hypothetical protein
VGGDSETFHDFGDREDLKLIVAVTATTDMAGIAVTEARGHVFASPVPAASASRSRRQSRRARYG